MVMVKKEKLELHFRLAYQFRKFQASTYYVTSIYHIIVRTALA
jgi:hypothetical protein